MTGPDLRTAFEHAPIGMAVATPRGVVLLANPALGRLLGRSAADLVGGTFFDVTHPDDLAEAEHNCERMQSGVTRILRHECRFLHAAGHVVWVLVSTSHVADTPERPAHLIMHIEDISATKALEAELIRQALHDPLTGLANRTLLTERISHALSTHVRHARPHCLLYVDLDGFKGVNDHFGHLAGDEVLRELARRISALLRPEDTAARLGGDEFAVLCVDIDPQHAEAVAVRLRAAAAEPFVVDGQAIVLSAAVGISVSSEPGADPTELLRRADLDMYETKRGRSADRPV